MNCLKTKLFAFFFAFIHFKRQFSIVWTHEILIVDVFRLSSKVVVTSIYNSSSPNEYKTFIADPLAKDPLITKAPINKPILVDSETVKILGQNYKIENYGPIGIQKCLSPFYSIGTCQKFCISSGIGSGIYIFSLYSLVYNTLENQVQLNITDASELKVNGEPINYAIIDCSVTTFNTVVGGFLIFATIFSILVFALFGFEIFEYLRFKAEMKDALIIGGEIRTITSKDFSMESFSTI
ncbi:putative integral membrane protein [Cryptosporidium felis]|nr:putative integral membrane protein [Cryptosporidium felis]